ncbi:hypothetical protein DIE19_24550 [Burkholderia sp. Bp9126]|nr:hypothetical protein DIE19_24550 [Burkholderia sp. Bp9126]
MIHNPDGSIVQAPITLWRMGVFFGGAATRRPSRFRRVLSAPAHAGVRYDERTCRPAARMSDRPLPPAHLPPS